MFAQSNALACVKIVAGYLFHPQPKAEICQPTFFDIQMPIYVQPYNRLHSSKPRPRSLELDGKELMIKQFLAILKSEA